MERRSSPGFTIVETLLFLALSGLFLLIAFLGVGTRSGQVQFTDSMRSLHSYIVKQQNDVLNGVNTRPDNPDCVIDASGAIVFQDEPLTIGQSDCIIIGRVFIFNTGSSTVEVFPVLARALSSATTSGLRYLKPDLSDLELLALNESAPHAKDDATLTTSYDIDWGTTFVQAYNVNTGSPINGIGFVRSPGSTNIYNFVLPDLPGVFDGNTGEDRLNFTKGTAPPPYLPIAQDVDATLCFKGANDQPGSLKIGGTQSDSIEITIDKPCP